MTLLAPASTDAKDTVEYTGLSEPIESEDLLHWQAQPTDLLNVPGKGADDGVNGGHPGVVVNGDRAFLFYFTHPGRAGTISPQDKDSLELRRSSIQVVELFLKDGQLTCDRDGVTDIALHAP